MVTTTETATVAVAITDNKPRVYVKYSVLSGIIRSPISVYDVNVPLLLTARSISISRRLLVSLASFPFFTLDSWFLARFFSEWFTNVHDTATRFDSFFFFSFWGSTTYDDSGSPLTSPTLSLDIPNSITNVQIKRDSVDRCSPFLGVGSLFPTDNSIRGSVDRCSPLRDGPQYRYSPSHLPSIY
jgi:hypothetical protein